MKTPGPDHPLRISRSPRRMRVLAAGHVIADSADVLMLEEADRPPAYYFKREDVERGFLSESPTTSECEYKGHATHYTTLIDGELLEDVAWSYESPYPAAEDLKGRVAFDGSRVEVYAVDEDDLRDHRHPTPDLQQPPYANS